EEESCKSGIVTCANSRIAFGLTGVARVVFGRPLEIRHWLMDTIMAAARPDFTIYNLLVRFRDRATQDFQRIPALKNLSRRDKRLTVMFAGYVYPSGGHPLAAYQSLAVCAIASNFDDCVSGSSSPEARDEFGLWTTCEKLPRREDMSMVQ